MAGLGGMERSVGSPFEGMPDDLWSKHTAEVQEKYNATVKASEEAKTATALLEDFCKQYIEGKAETEAMKLFKEKQSSETTKEAEKTKEPEKPKEPEKVLEVEQDAPDDGRKKVSAEAVQFGDDSTMNVMPTADGALLMCLGEGGMQYMLAGARASAGIKSGRYMFEVRIAEHLARAEPDGSKAIAPKQVCRVGVSLSRSSLFAGDTPESVCFDSDGHYMHAKKRQKTGAKFGGDTVAVVVNLDSASANANTISLFKGGVRVCPPQPLPENLIGKPLFPVVTYRNLTLEVNLGPTPHAPLPFTCHMISNAAVDDLELVPQRQKGDVCEVLFPVGLPEKGFFHWMDTFVAENPHFTELSDRKIVDWAVKSGIPKPAAGGSNDKPNMSFGVPLLDDGSVRRVIASIAPTLKRNFIVGELKANLVPAERSFVLSKFSAPHFKKTAAVLLGDPDKAYIESVQNAILAEKRSKAEADKKRKAIEAERNRLIEHKKRLAEQARSERKMAAAKKKKGGGDEVEEEETKKEDIPVDEETKMDVDDTPVELTEDEKKMVHRKSQAADMSEKVFAKAFMQFELPKKDEGFSEIKYVWEKEEAKCEEALKAYKHENKMTQKVEDLQPSAWFKEKHAEWTKTLAAWRKRSQEWKDPAKRKKLVAEKLEQVKAKGLDEATMKVDLDDIDILAVEDVLDIGSGEPLCSSFEFEDWALVAARYEIHLLLWAFRKDLNDPDRPSFPEAHLPFYTTKYYKKAFSHANFACATTTEALKLIKDVVEVNPSGILEPLLPEEKELEFFLKLTEEHRRDRVRRVDAGDEASILKFPRTSAAPAQPPPARTAIQSAAGARAAGSAGGGAAPPGALKRPWSAGPGQGGMQGGAWKAPGGGGSYPMYPSAPGVGTLLGRPGYMQR